MMEKGPSEFAGNDAACPGETELIRYVRGELDELSSHVVDKHLDLCASCDLQTTHLEDVIRATLASGSNQPDSHHLAEKGAELALERMLALARSLQDTDWLGGDQGRTAFEPGGEIDDFLIVRTLGSGGFATVYLAQQKSLQRLVALKVSQRRTLEAPVSIESRSS